MQTREKTATVKCVLCDGGARVPLAVAQMYGRVRTPRGGTACCPSCDGRGVVRAVIQVPMAPKEDHQ